MFNRILLDHLKSWKEKSDRKPLVLRGARQVGKTTLVNIFSTEYDQYIRLNLEKTEDLKIFDPSRTFEELITAIFFLKNKTRKPPNTLIFIDEIQNSPHAVKSLRYFYEEAPDLHVIAAGSLLETLFENEISFPVGRVEYLAVHPCSFSEFLVAMGEEKSADLLRQFPVPDYAHEKLMKLFNLYSLLGGMPAIIQNYAEYRDLVKLAPVYDSLVVSYLDDVEKYARNANLRQVIRHVIATSFFYSGTRITFERFGNSNYRSREVGEAFRTLEKAMLLQLVYPSESASLPVIPNYRKSPRLQMVDTGLVNYVSKIQKEVFNSQDITSVFRGKIAEHIIGQEFLAGEIFVSERLNFWTREQKNAQAEVDFILQIDGHLVPVEVKSGGSGKLRSLLLYMDLVQDDIAVRFWSGKSGTEELISKNGKPFILINLPLYAAGNLKEMIARGQFGRIKSQPD